MKLLCRALVLACMASLGGCAPDAGSDAAVTNHTEEIRSGSFATSIYPEAALVDGDSEYKCSGVLVAARVVVTAGHCVAVDTRFTVRLPAVSKSATGSNKWTDYHPTGEAVNPSSLDVAVVILERAIALPFYPPLASAPVANGSQAVNVGRIQNGDLSDARLFFGAPVAITQSTDFPLDYQSDAIIESGDSGGPVYVGQGPSRQIVAVNSGAGRSVQVLARIDLARAKIMQLIAENP